MLPGQRIAGAGWVDDASERLETEGFDRNEALPQFFWHRKDKVLIEMHMDDFHGCGPVGVVDRRVARLREIRLEGDGHLRRGALLALATRSIATRQGYADQRKSTAREEPDRAARHGEGEEVSHTKSH